MMPCSPAPPPSCYAILRAIGRTGRKFGVYPPSRSSPAYSVGGILYWCHTVCLQHHTVQHSATRSRPRQESRPRHPRRPTVAYPCTCSGTLLTSTSVAPRPIKKRALTEWQACLCVPGVLLLLLLRATPDGSQHHPQPSFQYSLGPIISRRGTCTVHAASRRCERR